MPEIPNYVEYMRRADALLPGKIKESHDGAFEVVNLGLQLARADGHDVYAMEKTAGERASCDRYADSILIPIGDGIGQVVDVVANDGGREAYICWIVQDTRPMSVAREPFDWPMPEEAPPAEPPVVTPEPTPEPEPTPTTDLTPILTRLDAILAAQQAQRTAVEQGLAKVAEAIQNFRFRF